MRLYPDYLPQPFGKLSPILSIHPDIWVTSLLVGPDAPRFGTESPESQDTW